MSNTIDNGSLTTIHHAAANQAKQRAQTGEGNGANSVTGAAAAIRADTTSADKVDLSGRVERLSALTEQVKAAPEVDKAKVAEMRAAIARNEFVVDRERIADGMINLEQDLK